MDDRPITKQRTLAQNNSIHLYLTWVARELANQGQTMQNVVQKINKVEIEPTMQNCKELIWHEIQKAMFKKDSTAFLTKQEVSEVYDVMSRWLAKNFEIDLPWPDDPDPAPLKDKEYVNIHE